MNRILIEECTDIDKLKSLCIRLYQQYFYTGEVLVSESKQEITADKAISKIRQYLRDNQYLINEWRNI